MKAGSVILDMAVETGGNVEGSVVNEIVTTQNGVKIMGIPNIPATLAAQSSAFYANNVYNFAITLFNKEGQLVINLEDEIQKALLITQAGELLFNKK
jgi:NAD(P) transhydrogenase subunit alpha